MQHILISCAFTTQVCFYMMRQVGLQVLTSTLEDDVFSDSWINVNSSVALKQKKERLNSLVILGSSML